MRRAVLFAAGGALRDRQQRERGNVEATGRRGGQRVIDGIVMTLGRGSVSQCIEKLKCFQTHLENFLERRRADPSERKQWRRPDFYRVFDQISRDVDANVMKLFRMEMKLTSARQVLDERLKKQAVNVPSRGHSLDETH